MKNKVLIGLATVLVSSSSFAYVLIGGGKVEEPQISGSPGFVVKEMPVTADQIAKFESDKKKAKMMYGNSSASISNVRGKVNEYIRVDGYHTVNIKNETSTSQSFRYVYDLYIDGYDNRYIRNITLNPGATFYDHTNTQGILQKSYPGTYHIDAETGTDGPGSYSHDVSHAIGAVSK